MLILITDGRAWTDLMIRRNQIQYLSTETKRCDSQMATMERMIEQQNADELRAKRQEDRLLAEHELRVRVLRIQEEFYKMQIDKMRSSGGKATGGGDSMDLEHI